MNLFLKIISGFGFILLLFFLVIIIYRGLSDEVDNNSQWVTVSEQIIKNSNRLQRNIIDMESGLRGFLLTGEEDVLKPYIEAKEELPSLFIESLRLLKNSSQKKELQAIFRLQKEWQNFADVIIEAKKNADESQGKENAFLRLYKTEMKNRIGYNISADIRLKFREFNSFEYSLREKRRAALK